MKKSVVLFCLAGSLLMQSCATVFGGPISSCQKTPPSQGGVHRQIRIVALIADIICCPIVCLPVDFIDGAIYQPCSGKGHKK